MVITIPRDEGVTIRQVAVSKEYSVSREDAPCPFLVLDALRDGKPHKYKRVMEELNYVVAVSKKAEDNLYRTISLLITYDPQLVCKGELGGVEYLIITDAGKKPLRWMDKLMSPDSSEHFIQRFKDFFYDHASRGSLVVECGYGYSTSIHTLDADWYSTELGHALLGHPRYMLELAEKALARLNLSDEPANVRFTYTNSPFLHFENLDPLWGKRADGGSLDDD